MNDTTPGTPEDVPDADAAAESGASGLSASDRTL